jgi:hypothetical protein
MSAFQLIYLSRLPASAIINDAVELTRRSGKSSAAGLAMPCCEPYRGIASTLSWPLASNLDRALVDRALAPAWLSNDGSRATANTRPSVARFNNNPRPCAWP